MKTQLLRLRSERFVTPGLLSTFLKANDHNTPEVYEAPNDEFNEYDLRCLLVKYKAILAEHPQDYIMVVSVTYQNEDKLFINISKDPYGNLMGVVYNRETYRNFIHGENLWEHYSEDEYSVRQFSTVFSHPLIDTTLIHPKPGYLSEGEMTTIDFLPKTETYEVRTEAPRPTVRVKAGSVNVEGLSLPDGLYILSRISD